MEWNDKNIDETMHNLGIVHKYVRSDDYISSKICGPMWSLTS